MQFRYLYLVSIKQNKVTKSLLTSLNEKLLRRCFCNVVRHFHHNYMATSERRWIATSQQGCNDVIVSTGVAAIGWTFHCKRKWAKLRFYGIYARTVTPNKYKTALRVSKVKSSWTLKSLTTTGWEYRWAAVKAVHEQLDSIKDMLLLLSNDKTPRVYHHSRSLLTAVCDLEFIFELHLLKVILLSTDALSLYPQGM